MNDIKRTTFYLPRWLHTAIKQEALDTEQDMTSIVVDHLAARYAEKNPLFFGSLPEVKLHNTEDLIQIEPSRTV
jgi:hypothetical protein